MTLTINTSKTVGEIVLNYPDTVRIMNRYKVDYCCNGHDSLDVALEKANVDKGIVIKELNAAITEQKTEEVIDWKTKKISDIIDYILSKHHTFMRDVLNELNSLVYTVLKVHYQNHGEQLLEVHHLVGLLKTELEAHLVKEEENLFPLIQAYEREPQNTDKEILKGFMNSTENEHDAAGDLFKKLELATNNFTPPQDVCNSYRRVFSLIEALEKDTFNHIHMENTVLFSMID